MRSSGSDQAVRSGVFAESLTIVWMTIEAAVALVAGIHAHSVLAVAFGLDSVIELFSGVVLLWLLLHAGKGGGRFQLRATRIAGSLLIVLCIYVAASIAFGVARHVEPESSLAVVVIAAAALVLMPLLAAWKRRINETLKSAALRADIAEAVACAYMAAFVVTGLAAQRLLRVWWLEYAASAVLLIWLMREARE